MHYSRSILVVIGLLVLARADMASAGWDEGVAAFTSKNYQGAAQELQLVVRRDPRGWMGHYYLGAALAQLQRKEEALHHLRKAYDLNPNDLSVKVALAQAYVGQGMNADAELVLQKAQQQIWTQLGYTYEKQKRYPAAIDAYKQAGDQDSVQRVQRLSRKRQVVKPPRRDSN